MVALVRLDAFEAFPALEFSGLKYFERLVVSSQLEFECSGKRFCLERNFIHGRYLRISRVAAHECPFNRFQRSESDLDCWYIGLTGGVFLVIGIFQLSELERKIHSKDKMRRM